MFVSQAVSQLWYTKADSYAACFQRPTRALDGLHAQISDWTVLATVLADSQNPQDSWCALQARLRIRIFILSCRDTLKAETQAVCFKRWWQLCMICKELTIVLCDSHLPIWRSPCTTIKGRHSYSMFRCKGQLWMVCMHNRYWESRALWQFIVSAEDFFKTLAMFVSQAVSQLWYTKADSYAACFQRPTRALDGLHAKYQIELYLRQF